MKDLPGLSLTPLLCIARFEKVSYCLACCNLNQTQPFPPPPQLQDPLTAALSDYPLSAQTEGLAGNPGGQILI